MSWIIQQIAAEDVGCLVPLLAEVQRIHAEALPDRYRPDPDDRELLGLLREWTSGEETTALTAVSRDGSVLGCLIYRIERREPNAFAQAQEWAFVDLVAVDEAWRRSGIGLAMMVEMKARLRALGVAKVRAEYVAFNTASAGLMRKAGLAPFVVIAEGLA